MNKRKFKKKNKDIIWVLMDGKPVRARLIGGTYKEEFGSVYQDVKRI